MTALVRDTDGTLHDGRFYDSLKALQDQIASTPSPFASTFSSHTLPRSRPSPGSDGDSSDSGRQLRTRTRSGRALLRPSPPSFDSDDDGSDSSSSTSHDGKGTTSRKPPRGHIEAENLRNDACEPRSFLAGQSLANLTDEEMIEELRCSQAQLEPRSVHGTDDQQTGRMTAQRPHATSTHHRLLRAHSLSDNTPLSSPTAFADLGRYQRLTPSQQSHAPSGLTSQPISSSISMPFKAERLADNYDGDDGDDGFAYAQTKLPPRRSPEEPVRELCRLRWSKGSRDNPVSSPSLSSTGSPALCPGDQESPSISPSFQYMPLPPSSAPPIVTQTKTGLNLSRPPSRAASSCSSNVDATPKAPQSSTFSQSSPKDLSMARSLRSRSQSQSQTHLQSFPSSSSIRARAFPFGRNQPEQRARDSSTSTMARGPTSAKDSPKSDASLNDEWASSFTSFVDLQNSARARLRAAMVSASSSPSTGASGAPSSRSSIAETGRDDMPARVRSASVGNHHITSVTGSHSPVNLNLALGSGPNAPLPGFGGRWFDEEARRLISHSSSAITSISRQTGGAKASPSPSQSPRLSELILGSLRPGSRTHSPLPAQEPSLAGSPILKARGVVQSQTGTSPRSQPVKLLSRSLAVGRSETGQRASLTNVRGTSVGAGEQSGSESPAAEELSSVFTRPDQDVGPLTSVPQKPMGRANSPGPSATQSRSLRYRTSLQLSLPQPGLPSFPGAVAYQPADALGLVLGGDGFSGQPGYMPSVLPPIPPTPAALVEDEDGQGAMGSEPQAGESGLALGLSLATSDNTGFSASSPPYQASAPGALDESYFPPLPQPLPGPSSFTPPVPLRAASVSLSRVFRRRVLSDAANTPTDTASPTFSAQGTPSDGFSCSSGGNSSDVAVHTGHFDGVMESPMQMGNLKRILTRTKRSFTTGTSTTIASNGMMTPVSTPRSAGTTSSSLSLPSTVLFSPIPLATPVQTDSASGTWETKRKDRARNRPRDSLELKRKGSVRSAHDGVSSSKHRGMLSEDGRPWMFGSGLVQNAEGAQDGQSSATSLPLALPYPLARTTSSLNLLGAPSTHPDTDSEGACEWMSSPVLGLHLEREHGEALQGKERQKGAADKTGGSDNESSRARLWKKIGLGRPSARSFSMSRTESKDWTVGSKSLSGDEDERFRTPTAPVSLGQAQQHQWPLTRKGYERGSLRGDGYPQEETMEEVDEERLDGHSRNLGDVGRRSRAFSCPRRNLTMPATSIYKHDEAEASSLDQAEHDLRKVCSTGATSPVSASQSPSHDLISASKRQMQNVGLRIRFGVLRAKRRWEEA
ncbi:unnamed protein product [Tilletia laevis]|uniref:Uncharacterized protein n=1 Tax=Tilletia caries TaxID=13290 RepID=A0ABN7IYN9_9BASI|nr:hypothetical protein CF336_g4270 [Tilletia laevis]CAD6890280.1 unnamed protein product [Tilletia caries]CAD6921498.1 unnamed protein product [Tilletia laevis]CAD6938683.1 unnamed protein product [Tilletia caries]